MPRITAHIPEPAALQTIHDKLHHLKLEAILIDLASYHVEYASADME